MSKPPRTPVNEIAATHPRTFFVTAKTAQGRSILQTDRMANLLIDVLRQQMRAGRLVMHEFVVMPDHAHFLLTVQADSSIEKAVQFIKGGFSYRAKRELDFKGEVWQRGFSEVRIHNDESLERHRGYIERNPVKRGLVTVAEEYPFGSLYLRRKKAESEQSVNSQGLKPADEIALFRHD